MITKRVFKSFEESFGIKGVYLVYGVVSQWIPRNPPPDPSNYDDAEADPQYKEAPEAVRQHHGQRGQPHQPSARASCASRTWAHHFQEAHKDEIDKESGQKKVKEEQAKQAQELKEDKEKQIEEDEGAARQR